MNSLPFLVLIKRMMFSFGDHRDVNVYSSILVHDHIELWGKQVIQIGFVFLFHFDFDFDFVFVFVFI